MTTYPHIDHNDYGTFVYVEFELPDIRKLVNNFWFLNQEELDDLIERSVKAHSERISLIYFVRQSLITRIHIILTMNLI